MTNTDPVGCTPLKPDFFHILLALSQRSLHGYGIIKDVEAATGGALRLEASPLYRRLRRLLEDGIIEETEPGPRSGSMDQRRRYYRLTPQGQRVVAVEAARLVGLAESQAVRTLATTVEGVG